MTHICVSKLTIIGSDNGLPPDRRQAIICTNAGIWLIRTLGTNFSEILGEIHSFSFKKMHLKMSSAKGRLFSPGLNVLSSIRRLFSSKSTKLFRFYRTKHDDVIKWKHFPRYWPFVRGITLHKGHWRGALMFSLICARINGWVNSDEAGDLRRHRTRSDVIVMRTKDVTKDR